MELDNDRPPTLNDMAFARDMILVHAGFKFPGNDPTIFRRNTIPSFHDDMQKEFDGKLIPHEIFIKKQQQVKNA